MDEKTKQRVKLYLERAQRMLDQDNLNLAARALYMVDLIKAGKV